MAKLTRIKRHPNYRLVKIHRNYTVEEIADLFKIHKNTVRTWIASGLPTCDKERPMLVLGTDLYSFLKARRVKNKQPCKPGEFYCLRCRVPRTPGGAMADCFPVTDTIGHLQAICPACIGIMNRRVNLTKLKPILTKLSITFRQAPEHINDRTEPNLNLDLKKGDREHA